jgi:hypothetical protein
MVGDNFWDGLILIFALIGFCIMWTFPFWLPLTRRNRKAGEPKQLY